MVVEEEEDVVRIGDGDGVEDDEDPAADSRVMGDKRVPDSSMEMVIVRDACE